jgi:serine/threonine protein kinase
MSTYTSEPGTRLAGRYRLVDQVSAGAGWTHWKATDETLNRSVTVLTFATGFPRVAETVTAARAASRLNDPRFSQVFDVEDAHHQAYVVMEWVVGESLLDMLAEGPLDPPRAASLLAETARAIASAHAAGLVHLRLDPACLHWTAGGGVKITGLGMDAALAGPALTEGAPALTGDTGLTGGEDPELTDTRDLGRLLYAALTGCWPGRPGSGPGLLPPAPENDGIPCTPRQVSAGVPAGMDAVTCQALFQRPSRHGPALRTAAEFADALAGVAPPVPFPVPDASTSASRTSRRYQPDGSTNPYPAAADTAAGSRPGGGNRRPPPRERSTVLRAIIGVVIVLVLAAIGVAAWSISHGLHNSAATPPARQHSSSPRAATAVPLKPVSASSFETTGTDDPGGAQYAIDGSASTAWHTDYYLGYSTFGNLKKGAGLLLDMGKQVRLSQVAVQFGTGCCTHVEIAIGNSTSPSALNTFTEVQRSTTAQGNTTFNVTSSATGRYVLIWITDLPLRTGFPNQYESLIYNVAVHGSAASQSG